MQWSFMLGKGQDLSCHYSLFVSNTRQAVDLDAFSCVSRRGTA